MALGAWGARGVDCVEHRPEERGATALALRLRVEAPNGALVHARGYGNGGALATVGDAGDVDGGF